MEFSRLEALTWHPPMALPPGLGSFFWAVGLNLFFLLTLVLVYARLKTSLPNGKHIYAPRLVRSANQCTSCSVHRSIVL